MSSEFFKAIRTGWKAAGILGEDTDDKTAFENATALTKQEFPGELTKGEYKAYTIGLRLRLLNDELIAKFDHLPDIEIPDEKD